MTRIATGVSTAKEAAAAARDAADDAAARLGGHEVDLAFLFLSAPHLGEAEAAADAARDALGPARLVGCVAEGVVGRDRELENGPAAIVWAGSLPGAVIETFHATAFDAGDEIAVSGFPDPTGADALTLIVDPLTFPPAPLLTRLNADHPRLPVVGGLSGAGRDAGAQALFLDDAIHAEGAVGAVLRNVGVRALVSQGCAPIGRDAVITRAEGNVVYELAGTPALARLREDVEALPPREQALVARGILAGLVIDENRPTYERGDYLMRGLLGADEESGAIAVGERVRVGQTLRFHIRDAAAADADLHSALGELDGVRAAGALLFTCNGRGTNMFPAAHHDARLVAERLATDAVAGFFCGGEIGPVGGRSFLHGFTATLAVFLAE
ncbi:MAG: FIST C-terminal domain-containing protein [Actinomycetota bacterium]|nr:FIST C-terminal domain-containing protein [Actinomycetota bacterium]